ncbi:MAG: transporter ATP-binding protein [Patescibacteria group bacterium]|jgi:zinc transport system ATP-binding protein|nr:transporter ATP-binding protein [Patescibacteria group bacterium]
MKDTSVIELRNVSFSFGEERVLEDVSFTVSQGDYIGLIGPNGGGKTTLLKLILGLLQPTAGEVVLFGRSAASSKERYKIGYVPQRVSQLDHSFPATVREIVRSGRTARRGFLKGFSLEDQKAVDRAMKVTGVESYQDRLVGQLSGGQRQRAFIAQALAAEPQVLILDEPTVGVDAASQEAFYTFLQEMNQKMGLTIILVSHDLEAVSSEIGSVLCLNRTLAIHGSPEDILHHHGGLHHLYHHH